MLALRGRKTAEKPQVTRTYGLTRTFAHAASRSARSDVVKAVETRRSASEMGGGIQRRGRERGRGGERKEEKEKGDEGSSRQARERERERGGRRRWRRRRRTECGVTLRESRGGSVVRVGWIGDWRRTDVRHEGMVGTRGMNEPADARGGDGRRGRLSLATWPKGCRGWGEGEGEAQGAGRTGRRGGWMSRFLIGWRRDR